MRDFTPGRSSLSDYRHEEEYFLDEHHPVDDDMDGYPRLRHSVAFGILIGVLVSAAIWSVGGLFLWWMFR